MSEELKSFLIFNDYSVTEMNFLRNFEFNANKDVELKFTFNGAVNISKDKEKATMELSCAIFEKEFAEGDAPFFLKIGILGHFELNVREADLDIENFQMNGMAILLPHLRAIVTSFTSQTGMAPVILPPINVYRAFEVIENNQDEK